MRNLLLNSAAFSIAYMSETVETVLVKGGDAGPVRVNKSDYDKDQSESGEKKYTLHTAKAANEKNDNAVIDQAGAAPQLAPGLQMPPAPSAPDFGPTPPIAPQTPSPNQRLVSKDGSKFYIVDHTGAKIEDAAIDPKGYKTEADAWNVISLLPH